MYHVCCKKCLLLERKKYEGKWVGNVVLPIPERQRNAF